jgi:hypothetical protein
MRTSLVVVEISPRIKKSADALVIAVLEPVEFRLSVDPPNKPAQVYQFPSKKQSIPNSPH